MAPIIYMIRKMQHSSSECCIFIVPIFPLYDTDPKHLPTITFQKASHKSRWPDLDFHYKIPYLKAARTWLLSLHTYLPYMHLTCCLRFVFLVIPDNIIAHLMLICKR